MVEILKRGDIPEERTYSATCAKCKSILRFKRAESRYVTDQRDGDAVVINCPVCQAEVWVNATKYDERPYSDNDIKRMMSGY